MVSFEQLSLLLMRAHPLSLGFPGFQVSIHLLLLLMQGGCSPPCVRDNKESRRRVCKPNEGLPVATSPIWAKGTG